MKFKVCYKFWTFPVYKANLLDFIKQQSKNSGLNVSWFLQFTWLCLIFQFIKQNLKKANDSRPDIFLIKRSFVL